MKKINLTLLFIVLTISCKAQSPVFDIEDRNNRVPEIQGFYIKDINNQLNAYEGTYVYTSGTSSLKIVLQKRTMYQIYAVSGIRYDDLIIGEYQYIKAGVEMINTLYKLANQNNHSITANRILIGNELGCSTCTPSEKRLAGGIVDEITHNSGDIQIRRVTVNGQAAIEIWIGWISRTYREGTPKPAKPYFGSYITLIKQ